MLTAVSSYVVRRLVSGRGARWDRARRASRFYLGHVLAAALAALGVPLGLAYGWLVRPRLDAVGAFWIAALTLGFLALPRAHELDDFDRDDHGTRSGDQSSMTSLQQTILSLLLDCRRRLGDPRYVVVVWAERQLDVLTLQSPRFDQTDPPLVSAIIPAKDEEESLAGCLASVCAQTYPNLEILVVDDRSADRTPEIARSFAENDPRIRVITIDQLPPGWTGKTHALQVASGQARGTWFWFLDADTRHVPENLSIVMEYARSNKAALASLIFELRCETFWENVVQPLAGVVLIQSFPLFWVNDDRRKLAFANGQYILVRRDAYQAAGGHFAVRERFVEDIGMAEYVKGLGLPIRVAVARGMRLGPACTPLSVSSFEAGAGSSTDALGRSPLATAGKDPRPLGFQSVGTPRPARLPDPAGNRSGQNLRALAPGFERGASRPFLILVLRRLYRLSVPATRYTAFFSAGEPGHGLGAHSLVDDVPDGPRDLARHGLWSDRDAAEGRRGTDGHEDRGLNRGNFHMTSRPHLMFWISRNPPPARRTWPRAGHLHE